MAPHAVGSLPLVKGWRWDLPLKHASTWSAQCLPGAACHHPSRMSCAAFMDPRCGSSGRIGRGKLPFSGARLLYYKGRPPAALQPRHGTPRSETAGGHPSCLWSQREAGRTLRYTNQPSPHVDKTRPGCIDPAAARLVRLPCGGAAEMMQRHSIASWYSLGCRPGVRATSGHGSEIAPAGVHLRRVARRARAYACTGVWRASVLRGLMQSPMDWLLHGASVGERGSRQATGEAIDTPSWGSMVAPGHDAVE